MKPMSRRTSFRIGALSTSALASGVTLAQSAQPEQAFEYASARFDNDTTCIVWPDGSVEKVATTIGRKDPGTADIRIWYLTVAMNLMARKGFQVVYIDNKDVVMSRSGTRPVREYAAVRFTGDNTSIVWPDGALERVLPAGTKKSYQPADIRMWFVTVAMSSMGRRGFRPVRLDRDMFWRMDTVDFWMEREVNG